jgi:hypothetical protein
MKELNAFVLLLAFFVYIVHRSNRKSPKEPKSDTLRESLQQIQLPGYAPYAMALVPLYLGYNHEQFPKIFEHGLVLYILFLAVRTMQLVNNRKSQRPIEFTSPVTTIMALLYVYHGIVERKHIRSAYLYVVAQALSVLILNPHVTASSLVDDSVLAHFLFYLFK